jgi:hypothetical protein
MKSKYLAKADYLRQLQKYATELYSLGDFSCSDPERAAVSSKIEGYALAGTTIEIVSMAEIQSVIDKIHLAQFGEEREARRLRILEESSQVPNSAEQEASPPNWEVYDSPAKDRKK